MNTPLLLLRKNIVLLLIFGSKVLFAESILGVSKNTVCPGENVEFWDDLSTLNQGNESFLYTIDYSDGTKESLREMHCYFKHSFQKAGAYKVHLIAFNGIKTITGETIIQVRNDIIPESFIDVSKNTLNPICPGTEVYFQTDWNQNYCFDYGDGLKGTNGTHEYKNQGVFQPVITVKNVCGNETKINGEPITVGSRNVYSASADAFIEDLPMHSEGFSINTEIHFRSMSAHTYSWDLGDGTTSVDQNPRHFYSKPGIYDIKLTLEDGCFNDTTLQMQLIIIDEKGDQLLMHQTITDELEVYPNPNKGEINVRVNVGESQSARIEVYDPTGKLTKEINLGPLFGETEQKVLLSSPRAGLYTLYLITESKTYHRSIVIDKQ